jgi:hypothetical protein
VFSEKSGQVIDSKGLEVSKTGKRRQVIEFAWVARDSRFILKMRDGRKSKDAVLRRWLADITTQDNMLVR